MQCWMICWRRLAESIGALINQLLSRPDLVVGGGKLFPALLNHVLRLLELGQGGGSDFASFVHSSIIPSWSRSLAISKKRFTSGRRRKFHAISNSSVSGKPMSSSVTCG